MADRKTPDITPLTHKAVFWIAVPIVMANIATPLLGVVDTAVVAQSGDPRQIGAIALGAFAFSALFWMFGFLRMGTSGLTAQAYGATDWNSMRVIPGQALLMALGFGGCADCRAAAFGSGGFVITWRLACREGADS
ncbi:MAG: MATE family efflux transporter [Parvularculales bacterium]